MVDDNPDETEERSLTGASRRKFMVAGAATWASVGLAGCTGDDDDDDADVGNDNDNDNDDTNTDDNDTEPDVDPNYVVTDDIIASSAYIPEGTGGFASACAPQRTFVPEMHPVFKIGIWDPETGNQISADDIDEVVVDTDLGETVELEWDDEDEEWSGSIEIPAGTEPGTVTYTVEVTNGAEFVRVGILESEFEVIELEAPAANYVVTTDTYTGSSGIPEDEAGGFAQACSPQRTFAQGMMVGFQIGIYDASTGEIVDDTVVDEALVDIDRLDEPLELGWDDEDEEWQVAWHMPEDEEPGTVTYEVQVTNDGEFHRVGIQEDSFPIIEYEG